MMKPDPPRGGESVVARDGPDSSGLAADEGSGRTVTTIGRTRLAAMRKLLESNSAAGASSRRVDATLPEQSPGARKASFVHVRRFTGESREGTIQRPYAVGPLPRRDECPTRIYSIPTAIDKGLVLN
jgi:hypothetical protein